jgi:hypothetical protein
LEAESFGEDEAGDEEEDGDEGESGFFDAEDDDGDEGDAGFDGDGLGVGGVDGVGGVGICGEDGDFVAQADASSSTITGARKRAARLRTDAMFMMSLPRSIWRRDLDVRACDEFHSWT